MYKVKGDGMIVNETVIQKVYFMGATSGTGVAYPSGAPKLTLVFCRVCVTPALVFSVVLCFMLVFHFILLDMVLF